MPTIDWVGLGTIIITAIVGGTIGYGIHYLQTRNQRRWQKLDEVHKTAMRFVQGFQMSMLKMASILQIMENGKLIPNGNYSEITKLPNELNQFTIDLSRAFVLKDAKLKGFYQEIIDKYEELVDSLTTTGTSSDDVEKIRNLIYKTVVEVSEVEVRIDERFEQLKSKVW